MFSSPKDELLDVEKILREGKLNKALELTRNLESRIDLDTNEQMEVKSFQLEITHNMGDHEKVYKLADLVINLSNELKLPFHKLDGLIFKTLSLVRLKKFKERDEIFDQLTVLLEQERNDQDLEFVKREIQYHSVKGEIFLEEHVFEKSLESYNHSLLLNEKLNNMYQNGLI